MASEPVDVAAIMDQHVEVRRTSTAADDTHMQAKDRMQVRSRSKSTRVTTHGLTEDSLALVPKQARRFRFEHIDVVTRSIGAAVDSLATALVVSYAGRKAALVLADRADFYVTRAAPAGGIATALTFCFAHLSGATRRSSQDVLLGAAVIHDRLPRRGGTDESPRSCLS